MERFFRKFPALITPVQVLMTLSLYAQCSLMIGTAAFPSVYLIYHYWQESQTWGFGLRLFVLSLIGAGGYFLYAIALIFVVASGCFVFRLKIKEGRYYLYSSPAIKWAVYNSLILIVRYTCMNFLRATPFLNLFYRMMGAKIGKNVQINTCIIGDCALLEIGDHTIIGGDVTLVAHVGEHNELIVKKVRIGSNVTVGIMSIIMPGVEIGDRVMIAANSVISKNTKIPSDSVWGGIPARQITSQK